jgi:O-antigen/teichoic acid export membrane protein
MEKDNRKTGTTQKSAETGKFTHDLIWVTVAQLTGSFILGIVTLPALTKNYSLEMFGVWSQAFVTVSLLSPIFCLELDMAVVRFLAADEDKARTRKALGSMLITVVMVCGFAFLGVGLFSSQIASLLFDNPDYTSFVLITFLWVVANTFFIFFSAYLRAKKRLRLLSVRSVILAVAEMALVIGLSSQGVRLEWVMGSVAASYGVMAMIFLVMIFREVGWPTPNLSRLRSYLMFSLPQIPGLVLLWLIASSDRYFITHFLGLSEAGIYSSSYQLASMTRLFYSPIIFVLYPTLSRFWDENRFKEVKSYLQHSTRLLLTLGIPAAVGIALLSQPLLNLLTTAEFLAGSDLVFLISIGTIFLGIYQINQQIILLQKRTKVLPLIIVFGAVTSVAMNVILISRIGIIGAGVSNIVSYSLLAIIVTVWASRTVGFKFDFRYIAKVIGATIPMAACIYFQKVTGIGGLILAVITGIIVYIIGLYIMRAFSEKDKRLITSTLTGFVPGYFKKGKTRV